MSEHQAYERLIGAKASTRPRGRFRPDNDGIDIALPIYRDMRAILRGRYVPNRLNNKGKPIPRVNEAKRAIVQARKEGAVL